MALPILDGNQTAATLSTIVTGGQHIPAHTVVSLGSQAISDITSAVSGVSVSISGTQTTTFGAVTGSVTVLNFPASQSVTFSQASVTFGATTGSVSVLNLPSTQTIAGTVTAVIDPQRYDSFMGEPILPMGWATADGDTVLSFNLVTQAKPLPVSGTVTAGFSDYEVLASRDWVSDDSDFVINLGGFSAVKILAAGAAGGVGGTISGGEWVDEFGINNISTPVQWVGLASASNILLEDYSWREANVVGPAIKFTSQSAHSTGGSLTVYGKKCSVDSGLTNSQLRASAVTVSGTVTANNPSGSLTTRFGSVTTANTAQITSAVTNTSRKYLLAQNISAGTVTIGIGFSPTTTQGIQLTAGAGLTFDSFCPTGAVFWLGAVTGAAFTILEN